MSLGYPMTAKNTPPRANNIVKNNKADGAQRKRLTIILLLLILAIVSYFAWSILKININAPDVVNQSVVDSKTVQTKPSSETKVNLENTAESIAANSANASTDLTTNSSLADAETSNEALEAKAILESPLPETDSLAKEEIDRLEDEYQRLKEKEKLAAEQVEMNKKLTEMKAEQIALLEQQIAQLEAVKVSQ